jgi:hypothetical protein
MGCNQGQARGCNPQDNFALTLWVVEVTCNRNGRTLPQLKDKRSADNASN